MIMSYDYRDLHGTTCLLTGATSGIGRAAALELARRGARLMLCARDRDGGKALSAQLSGGHAPDHRVLWGDLSRPHHVRAIAAQAADESIAIVIHNAGVMKQRREVTPEGFETTFATNHLAPFLLTRLLAAQGGRRELRVIVMSSAMHRWAPAIPWDDLQLSTSYDPMRAYALSKLYNILFTMELARRYRAEGVTAAAFDPGFTRTRLGRDANGWFRIFLKLTSPLQRDPAKPAAHLAALAASPETPNGCYVSGSRVEAPGRLATAEAAARLWAASEALVGS